MVKLIIFDWDDVFSIGSKEGYFACYQAVLDAFGISLDIDERNKRILEHWGQPYQIVIEDLLREHQEYVKQGWEVYRQNLYGQTYVNKLSLIDGAIELLLQLKERYTLAIASGIRPDILKDTIFPKFQIPDVFTEIITSHDLKDARLAKPNQFMAEEIMRRIGIAKDQTVAVGDAKNDVLMAQNAGVTPIVVLTGHLNRNQAEDLGVKYIIPKVTDIEEVLHKL